MIIDLYAGSWFDLDASGVVVATKRGARQGCRFGGLLFNLLYARVVRSAREALKALGFDFQLPTDPEAPLWQHRGGGHTAWEELFDVTYADDEAMTMLFALWEDAMARIPLALRAVEAAYAQWGFEINWGPDKCELMIVFCARGCKAAEAQITTQAGQQITFNSATGAERTIRVVKVYRHVGSLVQASGSEAANTEARVRAMRAAFNPLAGQLRSRAYWPATRVRLLRSLAHSRLLFDLEAGAAYSQAQRRRLQGQHVDTVRRTLRKAAPSTEQWHRGTDEQTLREAGVPTLWSQVRARRLNLLWSFARERQPHLVALLEPYSDDPGPWATELLEDLRALAERSARLQSEGLGDPYINPQAWWQFIRSRTKGQWKGLTAEVSHFALEVRTVPPMTTQRGEDGSGEGEDAQGLHVCADCPAQRARAFTSAKALTSHMQRAHGRIGPALECPLCGCRPASRARLLVHASRSTCAAAVAELPMLSLDTLQAVDPDAAEVLARSGDRAA